MDLKIGKKTYGPFAKPEKVHRELTTYDSQAELGYRITGFKVYCYLDLFSGLFYICAYIMWS